MVKFCEKQPKNASEEIPTFLAPDPLPQDPINPQRNAINHPGALLFDSEHLWCSPHEQGDRKGLFKRVGRLWVAFGSPLAALKSDLGGQNFKLRSPSGPKSVRCPGFSLSVPQSFSRPIILSCSQPGTKWNKTERFRSKTERLSFHGQPTNRNHQSTTNSRDAAR